MRLALAIVAGLLAAPIAVAQTPPTITASPPREVAVTVYRNPNRPRGQPIDLDDPRGFALITEQRTVRVPAGVSTIRFEGVSGGIIPVSAVVTGLPGGTIEKNRDARLLSPAALVDGSLGRGVTLRKTDRATGVVREEEALVVSGAANGIVLRTPSGIEALRCSGLPEAIRFDGVPVGLSAEPVLSVTTRSPRAATVKVTLSYLASQFDWSASYVGTIAPDGRTLDLFAWMTLANGTAQTIADAGVSAVAGRLSRRFVQTYRAVAGDLQLRCYPLGTTTSDLPSLEAQDIVVTASRVMMRSQAAAPAYMAAPAPPAPPAPPPPPPPPEDLGDLKLYRVPARVAVAANQQKQVALLHQPSVPFERVYLAQLYSADMDDRPVPIVLRMRNEAASHLGIALPAGTTALYQQRGDERLLVGLGNADDTASGQRFELEAGTSSQVTIAQAVDRQGAATVTLSNANAAAVTVEVRIGGAGMAVLDPTAAIEQVDGVWTWRASVPANGSAVLRYRWR